MSELLFECYRVPSVAYGIDSLFSYYYCVCGLVCLCVVCGLVEMSELLFECYRVPSVSYGIDCLFSYYYNARTLRDYDALVVSCGYQTTHILPVLGGRLCAPVCQRINVGGAAVDGFMQRVLQLKYPQHITSVTLNRSEVHTAVVK